MKNKKSLGQNWLKNRTILDAIARLAAGVEPSKIPHDLSGSFSCPKNLDKTICVEIGPGLGTLTSSLFRFFNQIIAIEIDRQLAEHLPKSFPGKNLTVINDDILNIPHVSSLLTYSKESNSEQCVPCTDYVVAGNIPYYITSPIVQKLLTDPVPAQKIVLLIQKEVAERIFDQKRQTLLSLFVQNRAEVALGPVVGRAEFTPPPKVDSQVIIFIPKPRPEIPDAVFGLIQRGFSAPRKKLLSNLSPLRSRQDLIAIFKTQHISIDARPADLSLLDWLHLHQSI